MKCPNCSTAIIDGAKFCHNCGNNVIHPSIRYNNIAPLSNNKAIVEQCGTYKYGIIDSKGEEIIPCIYDSIHADISPDFLIVSKNGQYGVIDWGNNILIPYRGDFMYETMYFEDGNTYHRYYSEGYFWIINDGKCGTINLKGKQIIPCIYDEVINDFEDGIATVKKGEDYLYIDYYGNEVRKIGDKNNILKD